MCGGCQRQRCDCRLHPEPAKCERDPVYLVDLAAAEAALGDYAAANASLAAAFDIRPADVPPDALPLVAMVPPPRRPASALRGGDEPLRERRGARPGNAEEGNV